MNAVPYDVQHFRAVMMVDHGTIFAEIGNIPPARREKRRQKVASVGPSDDLPRPKAADPIKHPPAPLRGAECECNDKPTARLRVKHFAYVSAKINPRRARPVHFIAILQLAGDLHSGPRNWNRVIIRA